MGGCYISSHDTILKQSDNNYPTINYYGGVVSVINAEFLNQIFEFRDVLILVCLYVYVQVCMCANVCMTFCTYAHDVFIWIRINAL